MEKSNIVKTVDQMADAATGVYEKIETAVTGVYEKIETAVVGGYTKVEDAFVERYLTKDGETVAQAKERLKQAEK